MKPIDLVCPTECSYLSLVLPFQKKPVFLFPFSTHPSDTYFYFRIPSRLFHQENAAIVLVLQGTEGVRTECTGVGLSGIRTRTCQQGNFL